MLWIDAFYLDKLREFDEMLNSKDTDYIPPKRIKISNEEVKAIPNLLLHGRIESRVNNPTGRPRGARGLLEFNGNTKKIKVKKLINSVNPVKSANTILSTNSIKPISKSITIQSIKPIKPINSIKLIRTRNQIKPPKPIEENKPSNPIRSSKTIKQADKAKRVRTVKPTKRLNSMFWQKFTKSKTSTPQKKDVSKESIDEIEVMEIVNGQKSDLNASLNLKVNLDVLYLTKNENPNLWLSNIHLRYAMQIIRTQFPSINIIARSPDMVPHLCSLDDFKTANNSFVIKDNSFLILLLAHNHWALLTNYRCLPNVWQLYDSLYQNSYVYELKNILCCFKQIYNSTSFFLVEHKSVIKQKGSSDCGLFCIANLVNLCNDIDPTRIHYDQSKMRSHYDECLKQDKFTVFPIINDLSTSKRSNSVDKTYVFNCVLEKFEKKK